MDYVGLLFLCPPDCMDLDGRRDKSLMLCMFVKKLFENDWVNLKLQIPHNFPYKPLNKKRLKIKIPKNFTC